MAESARIAISVTTGAGDLEALAAAIRARSLALRKTTRDSCVAAACQILRSLRARTRVAQSNKIPESAYDVELEDLYGSYVYNGGRRRIVARQGGIHGPVSPIRPALGFPAGSVSAAGTRVYSIKSRNVYAQYSKSVNAPAKKWYVLCQHEGQAHAYAQARLAHMIERESGMARHTLAVAAAKASTYVPELRADAAGFGGGRRSQRAEQIAVSAAVLTVTQTGGADSGRARIEFEDQLNYSLAAAGGAQTLAVAINKAARSMMGYALKTSRNMWPVSSAASSVERLAGDIATFEDMV